MTDIHDLGRRGEDYALELLRARGHQLLERNFRCKLGEIDLVTWHHGTLVFVEVRTRTKDPLRGAAETVGEVKQGRIIRAAQIYLARRTRWRKPPPCRFDVVWLEAQGDKIVGGGVIEGAFQT
jgi:putative endonuclease